MDQALQWLARGRDIVRKETNDKELQEEAEYKLRLALSNRTARVGVDTYGIEQPAWEKAQRRDLELAWERAQVEGLDYYRYTYAMELLRRELDDEARKKENPSGAVWLPRVIEALELLPLEERRQMAIDYKYSMAHAAFYARQFEKSIQQCAKVALEAREIGQLQIESKARFTQARAYLEQYLSSKSLYDWEESHKAIEQCRQGSESRKDIDIIANCHVIQAILWNSREPRDSKHLNIALDHISKVTGLWDEERGSLNTASDLGLGNLTSKYALRYRNEAPFDILGLAIDICYEIKDFREAWKWVEYAKARAFVDSLRIDEEQQREFSPINFTDVWPLPTTNEPLVFVHWAFVGETIYLLTRRSHIEKESLMFKLEITVSEVEEWYQTLLATKEDYSDVETAEEILSEISALCSPLAGRIFEDELMVLCPTGVLSKIPLHAIPLDGTTLLEMHPIVYTHSVSVLNKCYQRESEAVKRKKISLSKSIFGNPTGDTPAGELSVRELSKKLNANTYISRQATKNTFLSTCTASRLIHFHGHVVPAELKLDHSAMLFHDSERFTVQEAFGLGLQLERPLVVLIGCGSGAERFYSGDEPLGFISAFIYAGSPAVLGTMWPISDHLSGAPFTKAFYPDLGETDNEMSPVRSLDLARRLRDAALKIKADPKTAAPYFWAGFVLHGYWRFSV
ncbi:hypothetical protein ABW20_dc0106430 [Dactylellina cionopaga]|nr:hypothetical protein ABW20_dc0106430 [Dactylellina cionopaga]